MAAGEAEEEVGAERVAEAETAEVESESGVFGGDGAAGVENDRVE